MAETQQSQNPGLLANILAVAGFIILIVIIVWGAYHLLRLTGSGVSSLFSRITNGGSAIVITLPNSPVQSGKAFPLSWKYTPAESGTYAFLYQCKAGLRFDAAMSSGPAQAIPCGNAYTVGSGTTVSLIPTLSGTSSLEVPLSIVYMPSATSSSSSARPQGNATVMIIGGTSASPVKTPSQNTGTKTPTKTTAGIPDLSVRVLAIGVIDPATGAFVARYPTGPNDIAAVKFDIANNGGASTGTWYFTVQLPMNTAYVYNSPAQMNLTSGSHIENILRFRPVQSGGGTIMIRVDQSNTVHESNENNNTASQFISSPVFTGQYQPYVY